MSTESFDGVYKRRIKEGKHTKEEQFAFGIMLKEMRIEKKISLEDFSNKIGINYSVCASWENGNSLPENAGMIAVAVYGLEGEGFRKFMETYNLSKKAHEKKKIPSFLRTK